MNGRKLLKPILIVAIVGLLFSKTLTHLLTEAWWFEGVGFFGVFWTRLTWQIFVWVGTFAVYALFLWGNYRLAMRGTRHRAFRFFEGDNWLASAETSANFIAFVAIALAAFVVAIASLPAWETVLKFLHPTEFGNRDPIFRQDISFYVFKLPFYEGICYWLLGLLLAGLLLSGLTYALNSKIAPGRGWNISLAGQAKTHLSCLLAAIALPLAGMFWLARYRLLYSADGVVFGAGYTDVNVRLFAYKVMALLALGIAVTFLLSMWRRNFLLPLRGLGIVAIAWVLLGVIFPWFVQQSIVNPNELVKEKPYIANNIKFTQAAYRLDDVQRESYAAEARLNRQVLQNHQTTIRNIRLWDYRPLLSTYRQLQEIRLYYEFKDVDVDRYRIDDNYQQVMLSARELAFNQIPQEARTWVNQRLKYTHGYGLVMSPVNRATADGLPELYIKDIPPVSQIDLQVSQPAIYYGEQTDNYIFTGTTTDEFDYPQGDGNALTRYQGQGGVAIPSLWHRLAYAYDLGSLQILISNYFTNQSRIHYYRQIQERISHIAPFLRYDSDPYLVVIDGRLQWILDAYTVSDRYPYSKPVNPSQGDGGKLTEILRDRVNYIRNSVKILVDAYDGTVRFFAVDETDPLLATYRKIFPNLFEASTAIPEAVKAHFRYPQDLFVIQAQVYLAYHMTDPEVFYNREDLWNFPMQIYEGNPVRMEPYYVLVRLPGREEAEFLLILPFTPANKDNAIAWMAARSNGKDYGKLLLYEFPKQKLVYGPRQIEARIDQEPQISQQFSLWNQAGSRVIRGDLLVIPIEQSLLYVEPVYLRAEQGELPQLKRAIVVYDQAVVMEDSLSKSLAAIFGRVESETGLPALRNEGSSRLAQSALETYQNAQEALKRGNWAEYGRYQEQLQEILEQLSK
ncbi:MAG: UPF0182 family protein [Hydrococcus sp. C42_A2020_068]|nr:UPF0182 family protein [Hydrococcus sp. C42_A2020_068]